MDDDLDPKELDDEMEDDMEDDDDVPGKKGKKKSLDEDSLDALADEEEELSPEDSFDDVDLW